MITNHTVSFHKLRSMLGMSSHGTRGLLTSVTWKTRSWITETSSLLSQRTRANVVFLMVFSWGWDNPPVSSSYQSLSPVLNKKMLTVGSWDQTRTKDISFFNSSRWHSMKMHPDFFCNLVVRSTHFTSLVCCTSNKKEKGKKAGHVRKG